MHTTKYSIAEIKEALENGGCAVREAGNKLWINSTPNGHAGHYGYCVSGGDVRDIAKNIVKRNGEISGILRVNLK